MIKIGYDKELTCNMKSPLIWYISFDDMISDFYTSCFDLVYCNLRICHYMERRRVSNKELIEPPLRVTPQEAERFFQKIQERWDSTETYRQFRSTLLSLADTLSKVKKIVAFACSSLSLRDQDEGLEESILVRRAAYQHSLLLTLQAILLEADSQHPSDPVTCYAQDPLYTTSDKTVLKNHSITALDDPQGFLEVDESTIVISIAANVPVKEIITDIARPVIMIWDRLPHEGEENFGEIT